VPPWILVTDVDEPRSGADPVALVEPPTRRGLRGLAIDVGPLRRHRDFRLLFAGQAVTSSAA
jgi:hypothetical protein